MWRRLWQWLRGDGKSRRFRIGLVVLAAALGLCVTLLATSYTNPPAWKAVKHDLAEVRGVLGAGAVMVLPYLIVLFATIQGWVGGWWLARGAFKKEDAATDERNKADQRAEDARQQLQQAVGAPWGRFLSCHMEVTPPCPGHAILVKLLVVNHNTGCPMNIEVVPRYVTMGHKNVTDSVTPKIVKINGMPRAEKETSPKTAEFTINGVSTPPRGWVTVGGMWVATVLDADGKILDSVPLTMPAQHVNYMSTGGQVAATRGTPW